MTYGYAIGRVVFLPALLAPVSSRFRQKIPLLGSSSLFPTTGYALIILLIAFLSAHEVEEKSIFAKVII